MSRLRLKQLAQDSATTGQAVTWDGSKWAPATPSTGTGLPTATTKGTIAVYNGSAWVILAPGLSGQVLSADSTTSTGLAWITVSSSATIYAADTFTRSDSSTTLGVTETGSFTWAAVGSTTWGISSNQAYEPSNTDGGVALVNVGISDNVLVQAKIATLGSTFRGVVVRSDSTAQNMYWADTRSDGTVRIVKMVSGSATVLATVSGFSAGDTLGLRRAGSALTVYRNGGAVGGATDSAVTAGTYAGLRSGGQGGSGERFDDFLVTS